MLHLIRWKKDLAKMKDGYYQASARDCHFLPQTSRLYCQILFLVTTAYYLTNRH